MAILAALLLLAAAVVAYLVRRNGDITDVKADRWAAQRGVTLTAATRATVTGYLHTAGQLRGLGLVAGLALPTLYAWALGVRLRGVLPWASAFCGYLIGALYAEISLRRPAGGRAAASPRRLRQYLPPILLRGQVTVGAALAVASAGALLVPGTTEVVGRTPIPLALVAIAGLAGTPSLLGIEGWLVRRPQPILSPDQLAADDAIRSQSVQSVAASGTAMLLTLLSVPLWAMAASDVRILRWTMWLPGIVSTALALFVCLEFGHLRWRVRRQLPVGERGATPC